LNPRLLLIAGISVATAILLGGLALIFMRGDRPPAPPTSTVTSSTAAVGGPFTLVNANGETVTEKNFLGKYLMVFFGFTQCPEICPTTLDDMGRALQALGPDASKVTPIFISVDPEHDTPEIVGDYVAFYDTRIVGLTGSLEQITAAAKAYKIRFEKIELETGGYTMDHSSLIVVMGPDGTFRGLLRPEDTPEEMAAALSKWMKEG
jgi:protein SCO1/2